MSVRLPRWLSVLLVIAMTAAIAGGIPSVREPVLRAMGRTLVVADPLTRADVIVISLDADGAGALEAADLVRSGIASRVAVFADPPSLWDHEFIRRGLPYEDQAARLVRQLGWLGVSQVEQIPRTSAGSEGEAHVLPAWAQRHELASIVVVCSTDHSRRLRRVLDRAMRGHTTKVAIRPSRYSQFDPERWWQTRGDVRIMIVESQKLLLDFILHPW